MVRLAAFSGLVLSLLASGADAGQASGGFTAGIVIGGGATAARAAPAMTYTWGAAAISARQAGFDNLQRIERSDALYWFTGERGGGNYRIAVSIYSGEVMKVIPA